MDYNRAIIFIFIFDFLIGLIAIFFFLTSTFYQVLLFSILLILDLYFFYIYYCICFTYLMYIPFNVIKYSIKLDFFQDLSVLHNSFGFKSLIRIVLILSILCITNLKIIRCKILLKTNGIDT